ncbi:MAG: hypothetical protein KTR31_12325 [Myxococcales bacterium]|nr:hypothetical protein [Myxococcales bacterium]
MKSSIESETTLFDYFHDRVRDAWGTLDVELSDDTGLYLTALLVDRARTDAPRPRESTLVELHARAASAPPAEQARTYRELGDRSLYMVGYFEESLTRGTVGPRYYCEMGAAAYHRVDQVFKRWFANAFDRVFEELSCGFRQAVQVLRQVRTTVDEEPDVLMRLYQQWLETGSEQAATRLRERGLVLPPRSDEV